MGVATMYSTPELRACCPAFPSDRLCGWFCFWICFCIAVPTGQGFALISVAHRGLSPLIFTYSITQFSNGEIQPAEQREQNSRYRAHKDLISSCAHQSSGARHLQSICPAGEIAPVDLFRIQVLNMLKAHFLEVARQFLRIKESNKRFPRRGYAVGQQIKSHAIQRA